MARICLGTKGWSLAPVVEAVQAMRGVAYIVAVTVVAKPEASAASAIPAR